MDHEARTIPTLVHGRYLIARDAPPRSGRPLLMGFHGYAENAERHLEKLRRIPGVDGEWVVCAVGALHRFYHPKTRDVIASWMTRQDREQAIDDNVRYVAGVISRVRREEGTSDVLVLAGFSQGVAMAYRAALGCGSACHGLLVLGGDVPPEVAARRASWPPVLLGRGTGDPLYTEDKMDADLEALAAAGAEVTPCVFDGGHDWTDAYYEAAGRFLATILDSKEEDDGGRQRER